MHIKYEVQLTVFRAAEDGWFHGWFQTTGTLSHWGLQYIIMASETRDLRLSSQPLSVTARWAVLNYTAWWQGGTGTNNLPRDVTQLHADSKSNPQQPAVAHHLHCNTPYHYNVYVWAVCVWPWGLLYSWSDGLKLATGESSMSDVFLCQFPTCEKFPFLCLLAYTAYRRLCDYAPYKFTTYIDAGTVKVYCTLSCICMHTTYYVITTNRIFGNNSGKP